MTYSLHQRRLCFIVAGSSMVSAINRQILALPQTTQQRDRGRGKEIISYINNALDMSFIRFFLLSGLNDARNISNKVITEL